MMLAAALAPAGCAAGPEESDEADVAQAEQAIAALPKVVTMDYAGAVPGQVRYQEGWGDSPMLAGWLDQGDHHLSGDFMGLGHSQMMHFNRQVGGGRLMILDYAAGAVPGQVKYWEDWGQSPLLNGWVDDGDLQLTGDFLGLGRTQVMYVNRQVGGGKIMIVDYASGAAPGQVKYWENWGQSPLLSGWLDDGDLQLTGDFLGLGRTQVMYVNRQVGGGKVMIVDYAAAAPGSVHYWENWGQSPLLSGWLDDGDLQLTGDFRGLGRTQVMYVNRQVGGGKVMVVDYAGAAPGSVPYWENWGQSSLLDDLLDRGDLRFVGDFAALGRAQVQLVNVSSDDLLAQKFAPRLRFDSAIHGYPMSAQTFYDQAVAVPQTYRVENLDYSTIANNSVPTYYQTIRCGDQLRIMYFWFYGYQSTCDGISGSHNGDWERVMVTLSDDSSQIAAVTYYMHGKRYTRLAARGGFEVEDGQHPVAYVGKSSHASFHAQGGSSNTCLPWEEYRNNGNGTHMDTWNNLVNLESNGEPWMLADRAGGFEWGDDGVSTHPTTDGPSCDMNAADWSFTVPTWWRSQCQIGDDDSGTSCIQQCAPGYDQHPLTCTDCSGFWPWEWSCDTYSRTIYGYDWTIPTTDHGLLVDDYD
jgi:hypothetical protein